MTNPRNARTTSRGRSYKWRDETFDSVTTILNGGVPKPALTNWAAKSVAEFVAENIDQVVAIANKDKAAAIDLCKGSPWRQRDKAADLGSLIHSFAEAHVLGAPRPEYPPEAEAQMAHFEAFLEDFQPTYEMTEATVYNRKFGYAGTLDAILVSGGQRLLVDYKSGKDVYGEVSLQLAAYRFAEFVGMPNGDEVPMPAVDGAAVLHLSPRGYRFIPVQADEVAFRFFLYAQQVRIFSESVSREVLGAPLSPGDLEEVPA